MRGCRYGNGVAHLLVHYELEEMSSVYDKESEYSFLFLKVVVLFLFENVTALVSFQE